MLAIKERESLILQIMIYCMYYSHDVTYVILQISSILSLIIVFCC